MGSQQECIVGHVYIYKIQYTTKKHVSRTVVDCRVECEGWAECAGYALQVVRDMPYLSHNHWGQTTEN